MQRGLSRLRLLVATVTVGLGTLVAPAVAGATPSNFVIMFSDPGDYIGQGLQRVFDPSNSEITLDGDASQLGVAVSGGTAGDSYLMEFAAPRGQELTPGVYVGALRFSEAGHPGIDIFGDG